MLEDETSGYYSAKTVILSQYIRVTETDKQTTSDDNTGTLHGNVWLKTDKHAPAGSKGYTHSSVSLCLGGVVTGTGW